MTRRTHHRRGHAGGLRPRHAGQHRQGGGAGARGRAPRRAGRAAAGAVPGHLLLHASRTRSGSRPPTPWPSTRACWRCRSSRTELGVVIPISFFEKDGPRYYNSVAIADADGAILGVYRKSHIPDGPGYQEKYYFRPGDTGFKAWTTQAGTIGVGICWDQWFPEAARAMVLAGADVLFYPTAIGSEPYDAALDTHQQWQRAMQGHAVANAVPVVAANRIGVEDNDGVRQRFYGHSFIADHRGEIVESLGDKDEGVLVHTFDLARHRALPRRLGLLPRPPPRALRQEPGLTDAVVNPSWGASYKSS